MGLHSLDRLKKLGRKKAGSSKEEEKDEEKIQECMVGFWSFDKTLEEKIEANHGSCVGIKFPGEPENKYKFACKADSNPKPNACCVTRESTELGLILKKY